MTPPDAVDDKLVNLLRPCLEEAAIVLTVVMSLVLRRCSLLLLTGSLLNISVFSLVFVHVQRRQHSDH